MGQLGSFGHGQRYRQELQRRIAAINGFLNAHSWYGARQVVEQQQDLFDDLSLELLDQLRTQARNLDSDLAIAYDQVSGVIARCRTVGVDAAFEELRGVRKHRAPKQNLLVADPGATSPALVAYIEADGADALDVIEQHPEIISESSIRRIDNYIQQFERQGDRKSVKTLRSRRDLLRRLLP